MSFSETGEPAHPRLAVVAEAFVSSTLVELLDWLTVSAPEVTAVELGSGGYAPQPHVERDVLLFSRRHRDDWLAQIRGRGFEIAALNAWGNPLHPERELGARHDRELRDSIRLAAELGVDRLVALAGCPAAAPGDRTPHFAAGGWLPYLEGIYEAQWEQRVGPYWSELSEFARSQHPDLLICIELHPGTCVYNVETFGRLAGLGPNLCANLDPSHFFWMQMDAEAVLEALAPRVAHVHAKDVVFNERVLALQGLLHHRWPGPSYETPWQFATVGAGHDTDWWTRFVGRLGDSVKAVAIEHEDPDTSARDGVPQAARLLSQALTAAKVGAM